MIVSFDFDGTLDTPDGMSYAKELISRGYEVHVTTQRPPNFHRDVFGVAKKLGIKLSNIHFCGIMNKKFVLEDIDYVFHLDDNVEECEETPRSVLFDNNFIINCEKLLK